MKRFLLILSAHLSLLNAQSPELTLLLSKMNEASDLFAKVDEAEKKQQSMSNNLQIKMIVTAYIAAPLAICSLAALGWKGNDSSALVKALAVFSPTIAVASYGHTENSIAEHQAHFDSWFPLSKKTFELLYDEGLPLIQKIPSEERATALSAIENHLKNCPTDDCKRQFGLLKQWVS